jgi:tRNA (guanine-N7-)-methyltransferase
MRQRHIKGVEQKLAALSHHLIEQPETLKGTWATLQDDAHTKRVFIEFGCGKGRFITQKANHHPEDLFIGVEGNENVVLRALEKLEISGLQNLKFVASYVENVLDWFEPEELSGIYLNFSDPWPKPRHERRRLTHGNRLIGYMKVLKPGGFIEFKTDNQDLFRFTMDEIHRLGLQVEEQADDLHASTFEAKETITEYEEKFSSWGKNIFYVKVRKE